MTDIPTPVSGEVPRTLVPGVVWDEAAEAHFRTYYALVMERGGPEEFALRDAKWKVEIALHRAFIGQQMRAALGCKTTAEKRQLMSWWTNHFGAARAADLAKLARDESFPKTAATWG